MYFFAQGIEEMDMCDCRCHQERREYIIATKQDQCHRDVWKRFLFTPEMQYA